jgi:hypothetical protein
LMDKGFSLDMHQDDATPSLPHRSFAQNVPAQSRP